MKSSLFVFLGIFEKESNVNVEILKDQLQNKFSNLYDNVKFSIKNNILYVTFTKPDFRYYISFIDEKLMSDYDQLAKDFELPWDKKPIDSDRLDKINNWIKKENWINYNPDPEVEHIILTEMEKFNDIKIYCIPSMESVSTQTIFRKPIGYFIIGLALFLFDFGLLTFDALGLPPKTANWLGIVCLLISQLFVWIALIKGIRSVKKKENSFATFAFDVIAIIGSSIIILLFIYLVSLLTLWNR